MNLLIMGGPGAGKGTMSEKILKKYNVQHISTGDIFRNEMANQTELGILAKSYIDQGLLVPDDVTNQMVKSYLEKTDLGNGYLLDGSRAPLIRQRPLTKDEGNILAIGRVISLSIAFEELAGRVTGRRICKKCGAIYHVKSHPPKVEGICDVCGSELIQRKDDTVESLTVRLDEYRRQTEPVMLYYGNQGLLRSVNANQAIEDVWKDTQKALED